MIKLVLVSDKLATSESQVTFLHFLMWQSCEGQSVCVFRSITYLLFCSVSNGVAKNSSFNAAAE